MNSRGFAGHSIDFMLTRHGRRHPMALTHETCAKWTQIPAFMPQQNGAAGGMSPRATRWRGRRVEAGEASHGWPPGTQ
jgi:hypothetical protein